MVDDASADDTAQVVEQFDDARLFYYRHETNQGASAARNTGISHSKGEFIAFLDDDDEWLPSKLEKQVPLLVSSPPEVGMVYCWMDYFDAEGRLVKEHHPTHRGYVFPLVLDRQRIGGCPTLLVRRSVFEEVGGFDESLPRGNDGDFDRRVCLKYEVDFVPEVLVKVYIAHQHERITSRWDEDGIRYAIRSQEVKLEKFREVLPKYPRQTADILASIGYYYSLFPSPRESIHFLWRAFRWCATSRKVYLYTFRSIKNFLQ